MEHVDELIAAHALHALDADDERIVVEHLAGCERCRTQLRELESVASVLAYAAPAAVPPPELRERLLEAVAPVVATPIAAVVEPEPARGRWWWWPRFAAVAVPALTVAVLGLAIWNVSLRDDVQNGEVQAVAPAPRVGSVVAYGDGQATLFGNLRPAPAGHVYEAWVLPKGETVPIAAGTFRGGNSLSFTLTHPAAAGDTIIITLEPGNGGSKPLGPAVTKGVLAS